MLPLAKLAKVVGGELYRAAGSEVVTGVSYNSRRVQPGDVFIAIPGLKDDGAKFVQRCTCERGRHASFPSW